MHTKCSFDCSVLLDGVLCFSHECLFLAILFILEQACMQGVSGVSGNPLWQLVFIVNGCMVWHS